MSCILENRSLVFDCAARYEGVSLNECVQQGPDLTNNLEAIALMADIEAMFCQVSVKPNDQDVLRFLWWLDGDMSREPETFLVFGATYALMPCYARLRITELIFHKK